MKRERLEKGWLWARRGLALAVLGTVTWLSLADGESLRAEVEAPWFWGLVRALGVPADKAAHAAYNAYIATVQPRVKALSAELEAIKKSVPAELLEMYASLRAAKKMPAFVPYRTDAGTCGRCFMEVSGDTRGKLRNPGDYAECPNCRRILFIPEN